MGLGVSGGLEPVLNAGFDGMAGMAGMVGWASYEETLKSQKGIQQ